MQLILRLIKKFSKSWPHILKVKKFEAKNVYNVTLDGDILPCSVINSGCDTAQGKICL